jgi:hypothetical protein
MVSLTNILVKCEIFSKKDWHRLEYGLNTPLWAVQIINNPEKVLLSA